MGLAEDLGREQRVQVLLRRPFLPDRLRREQRVFLARQVWLDIKRPPPFPRQGEQKTEPTKAKNGLQLTRVDLR